MFKKTMQILGLLILVFDNRQRESASSKDDASCCRHVRPKDFNIHLTHSSSNSYKLFLMEELLVYIFYSPSPKKR